MRRFIFLFACCVVVCGTTVSRLDAASNHLVRVMNFFFTPTNLTIHPGDSVTWRNDSPTPHDSTDRNFSRRLFSGFMPGFGDQYSFTFTNVGEYPYVCVTHFFDVAPWQTGLVVVASVNLPPSVAITNPANGAFFTPPASFTIDAHATDSDGSVASVEFFLNGASAGISHGPAFTTNVSGLGVGNYVLTALATDNQGATNISPPVNIFVQEIPPTNFTLNVLINPTNTGTILITPPPGTNGSYLAGTTVALAAQPNAGFRFVNWSDDVASTNNPLLLVMNADQRVTANFAPVEPLDFSALAGAYSGLLIDDAATNYTLASYTSSGFLALRLSRTGAYRGDAVIGGIHTFVVGQFDRFGYAPLVARRGTLSGSLQIDSAGLRMRGLLTDGRQAPQFLLYRNIPLATLAGDYSLTLGKAEPVEREGHAQLRILSNGKATLRGTLGDGTPFFERTFVSTDSTISWFVPLYGHRGVVLGSVAASEETARGTARWFRPGNSRNLNYPDGFGLVIPVIGSRSE